IQPRHDALDDGRFRPPRAAAGSGRRGRHEPRKEPPMIQVQYISCVNDAGFVMNFSIRYLDQDGNWHTASWNSGNYPIDQSKTSPDLATIGVPSDAIAVAPYVHAILGQSELGSPYVQYAANGQTATYEVKGTVDSFSVQLTGPTAHARAKARL